MASGLFSSSSTVNLENVQFNSNYALGQGTVSVLSDSFFNCTLCTFFNNSANDSSAIFANDNLFGLFSL